MFDSGSPLRRAGTHQMLGLFIGDRVGDHFTLFTADNGGGLVVGQRTIVIPVGF